MLGWHVHRDDGVLNLQEHSNQLSAIGVNTPVLQFFVTGPQSHTTLSTEVVPRNSIGIVHGAYIDNPWNKARGSITNLRKDMKIAHSIGCIGVIIHLGKLDNIEWVFSHLQDLPDITLYLETNAAKPGANTYETPDKMLQLKKKVNKYRGKLRVGYCIDTAHLFANGCSFQSSKYVSTWLSEVFTPSDHVMFHLNDSSEELGSGKDKHTRIGHGNIWGNGNGWKTIIKYASTHNYPVVIERHSNHMSLEEITHILKN
jgi:endonuclease IV